MRISVTDIDAYLYWRDQPDMTLADLRARLMHTDPPSIQMAIGKALHAAVETAALGAVVLSVDVGDGISLAVERPLALEGWPVRECKLEVPIDVPGFGQVLLVGRVDATDGQTVMDIKTTSRFDPEKLFDAYQWRFYLWMTGAKRFVWDVFEISDPLVRAPGVYRVTGQHRLEQWAYPGMEDHCLAMLQEFCGVVREALPEYPAVRVAA